MDGSKHVMLRSELGWFLVAKAPRPACVGATEPRSVCLTIRCADRSKVSHTSTFHHHPKKRGQEPVTLDQRFWDARPPTTVQQRDARPGAPMLPSRPSPRPAYARPRLPQFDLAKHGFSPCKEDATTSRVTYLASGVKPCPGAHAALLPRRAWADAARDDALFRPLYHPPTHPLTYPIHDESRGRNVSLEWRIRKAMLIQACRKRHRHSKSSTAIKKPKTKNKQRTTRSNTQR